MRAPRLAPHPQVLLQRLVRAAPVAAARAFGVAADGGDTLAHATVEREGC